MKKRTPAKSARGYLHGFSAEEQARLFHQARFYEPDTFAGVAYPDQGRILEVGCGVGAQTEILLERFPELSVRGIDASPEQLKIARKHLASQVRSGRAHFDQGDALHLPYSDNEFDGAFLSWFLEHVKSPVDILREIRRTMKPQATIFCTEVLNSTFYVHPYSPATLQYWFAFNDHQWNLGGDPFVGAKLANYLTAAGFQNVVTENVVFHLDNRKPKRRAQFIAEWTSQLLSAADELIQAGRVTPDVAREMERELLRLKDDPDAVFYNAFIKAKAQAL